MREAYNKDFSIIFDQLLAKANLSCYRISKFSHIDHCYLSCLINGTKKNPGPQIIMRIGLALAHYSDNEILIKSVGLSICIY